jgi:CDP-glucose 4,6-dehydratase
MAISYQERTVLVTGHNGFTGSWLCEWLLGEGAKVIGVSLPDDGMDPRYQLYRQSGLAQRLTSSYQADIRNRENVNRIFEVHKPDLVFHLAAQPLVLNSYRDPHTTYETNVLGTLNVLDAARRAGVSRVVNITSDKAYKNREWVWPYRENDELGGHDIYSSSKACADILAQSYWLSFCQDGMSIITCRSGNIIGGGDWAENRIVPDIMRAARRGERVQIRSPHAIRPWQHVLEAVNGYALAGAYQQSLLDGGAVNFGPGDTSFKTVQELISEIEKLMPILVEIGKNDQHEAKTLKLDSSLAANTLSWTPTLNFEQTVQLTAKFYQNFDASTYTGELMQKDIGFFKAQQ